MEGSIRAAHSQSDRVIGIFGSGRDPNRGPVNTGTGKGDRDGKIDAMREPNGGLADGHGKRFAALWRHNANIHGHVGIQCHRLHRIKSAGSSSDKSQSMTKAGANDLQTRAQGIVGKCDATAAPYVGALQRLLTEQGQRLRSGALNVEIDRHRKERDRGVVMQGGKGFRGAPGQDRRQFPGAGLSGDKRIGHAATDPSMTDQPDATVCVLMHLIGSTRRGSIAHGNGHHSSDVFGYADAIG